MKKAILGLAGLVFIACLMYVLYPGIMQFLHLDKTPGLATQTPPREKRKPEAPAPSPPDLSATVYPAPQRPPEQNALPDVVSRALASAREAEEKGDLVSARNAYSDAYKAIVLDSLHVDNREELLDGLRSSLDGLNRRIYYDKWSLFEGQEFYVVRPDDYLITIAKKFGVTDDFLARINGIHNKNIIRAGDKLKIVGGTFNAVIDLSSRKLYVLHGENYFCEYDVSVGRAGRETPVDTYTVGRKERQPEWTDPDTGKVFRPGDPRYPLGARWITLVGDRVGRIGIGIHGQSGDAVSEIGGAVSRGCIRMRNRDVEKLFALLTSGKSRILVKK